MEPRRGRLVRPLLEVTRDGTREWCRSRGLDWCEDPTNADTYYARARVRHGVMPHLRELNPAAERNIAETARRLRDEQALVEDAVDRAFERHGPAPELAALRREPGALARLLLARLAGVAVSPARAAEILRLADHGTHELDISQGVRAVVEYGRVRFASGPDAEAPGPVALPVPGAVRFGDWEVEAHLGDRGEAVVSAHQLGAGATVRAWRDGDRMRPAGLGGSKSLQDLFTDRKVPRGLRRSLPVVEAEGEIVWVAGVAAVERVPGDPVGLDARQVSAGGA
jgi:tRNA(Ile)-lysidine synthase